MAVAEGDLSQEVTVQAHGEVAALASTVNGMVALLRVFAAEFTRVVLLTGTECILGGKAEVASMSGEWKEALAHQPGLIQAWVRKASVDVELGSLERAMEDFEAALALDPSDPDIYYHRAQVYNVTEQHHLAIADYEKSIELDSSFVFSHVQRAVAVYKTGDAARALKMFEGYFQTHPDVPEVHNYYGELLFAEQQFEEAMTQLDLAIDLDKNRPGPRKVHPIVNKAMVHATAFQNYNRATSLCEEALAINDRCEGAIQQAAQVKLQSNDMVVISIIVTRKPKSSTMDVSQLVSQDQHTTCSIRKCQLT